jgi:hypothetical protein
MREKDGEHFRKFLITALREGNVSFSQRASTDRVSKFGWTTAYSISIIIQALENGSPISTSETVHNKKHKGEQLFLLKIKIDRTIHENDLWAELRIKMKNDRFDVFIFSFHQWDN